MRVCVSHHNFSSCSNVETDHDSDSPGRFESHLAESSKHRQYSDKKIGESIETGSTNSMGIPRSCVAETSVPVDAHQTTEKAERSRLRQSIWTTLSDASTGSIFITSRNESEDRISGVLAAQTSQMSKDDLEDCSSEFLTARTTQSGRSFYTANPSWEDEKLSKVALTHPFIDCEYYKILRSKSLWPVDFMEEQDWSGRGQHAEFRLDERNKVDEILHVQELLGSTSSAIVYSVKCRRIFLARKTILCNRRMTKAKAIEEVAHLYRLSHAHVVRVIGTYTIGAELSILIYPVAEYNLETFLDRLMSRVPEGLGWKTMLRALPRFIGCLANAMAHIHERMTKHMDIKPKNLLIRHVGVPSSGPCHDGRGLYGYKIYVADFGIARSYATFDDMETEGPTMFTRKYAAPEVIDKGPRGRPADIFSLGCVFVEIYATWLSAVKMRKAHVRLKVAAQRTREDAGSEDTPLSILKDLLMAASNGDSSYQANIDAVQEFLGSMSGNSGPDLLELAQGMILQDPTERFTAIDLLERVGTAPCCKTGSDRLEAARWKEVEIEEFYNIKSGARSLVKVI